MAGQFRIMKSVHWSEENDLSEGIQLLGFIFAQLIDIAILARDSSAE
jgi:hypothetical protein